ncbi:hypothetical protein FZW96_07390 [Bacillus sp. BGMRC 2118]|nr:hypothetical protein FZW96_07390 [Bacillus sp. BGMRC 2118]
MRKQIISVVIVLVMVGTLNACTSAEDMVMVTTDIVYAQRSWSVYEDNKDAFPKDVIEMVQSTLPEFDTSPYTADEKPQSISSHDLIYSLREVKEQVSDEEYKRLYQEFADRYDEVMEHKDAIKQMDKLEDELVHLKTMAPDSSKSLYFHGQVSTIIDEINWYREDYEKKKDEKEDTSWHEQNIVEKLIYLNIIAELVTTRPDVLNYDGNGSFFNYLDQTIRSVQDQNQNVQPMEQESDSLTEDEKNAALNKALDIVKDRLKGYGEVITYAGDHTVNGQTYYAFDCQKLNEEESYFTLFVNAVDDKVYKDDRGFETEWFPEN